MLGIGRIRAIIPLSLKGGVTLVVFKFQLPIPNSTAFRNISKHEFSSSHSLKVGSYSGSHVSDDHMNDTYADRHASGAAGQG